MSLLTRCIGCSQPYWPEANADPKASYCPGCEQKQAAMRNAEEALPVTESGMDEMASFADRARAQEPAGRGSWKRFAPLSSLPPEQRILKQKPGERTVQPRQLAGDPPASVPAQRNAGRQVGFNCPSCLAVLIIKAPENYDGYAAPCPNCQVVILPPRIAPSNPFTLHATPGTRAQLPPAAPAPRQTAPQQPAASPQASASTESPPRRQSHLPPPRNAVAMAALL